MERTLEFPSPEAARVAGGVPRGSDRPDLYLPDCTLPDAARSYLEVIRPTRTYPSQQVFNYGWVLGEGVPDETMREASGLLGVAGTTPGS